MKILIAYDGSACSDEAMEDLRYSGLPRENEVRVVSVAHPGGSVGMKEIEALADKTRARVQFQFPAWSVSSEALWGEPANILHKTILRWTPDLVVMGSHGRSTAGRLLLGSVSLHVLHHSPCSVRVVRTGARMPDVPLRLLVATDGSPEGAAAVEAVARRSWPDGTQARIVSVAETLVSSLPVLVPAFDGGPFAAGAAFQAADASDARQRASLQSIADESVWRLESRGLTVDAAVLEGNPRCEIVAEAKRWQADTVFVGARGLGALDRLLLGSVSTSAVTHAHCTVEVVRQL